MKVYMGTDIIEVDRIKEAIEKKHFKSRVFTENEIDYCEKSESMKYQHYAARFAGKEAVYKAMSPLLENKYDISWKNIEIYNDKNSRPMVRLIDTNIENLKIDISLSHIKKYATATAVAIVNED